MQFALVLFRYFPFGGLQRDCAGFARALLAAGHGVRLYCMAWEGEAIAGAELCLLPVRGLSHPARQKRFYARLRADLAARPVDAVVGCNKMPGLDIYFAADSCFLASAAAGGGRRWTPRFRHYAAWERAVFDPAADTHVLFLTAAQRDVYQQHYGTPPRRGHLLPPGVDPSRRAPDNAAARRQGMRRALELEHLEFTLLFVGSAFHTKGLDRAIATVARLREEQPGVKTCLLVVGQGRPRRYRALARKLGVGDAVDFLGGREDIGDLMLAADVLLHPARTEAGGIVLLEALAAGLTVVTTAACGYAPCVEQARGGIVVAAPFDQAALDKAVMRCIDGVYRAECKRSALQYADREALYSMHAAGAELMVRLAGADAVAGTDA